VLRGESTVMDRLSRVWRACCAWVTLRSEGRCNLVIHDEGKTAQLQGDHEGRRGFTT